MFYVESHAFLFKKSQYLIITARCMRYRQQKMTMNSIATIGSLSSERIPIFKKTLSTTVIVL